MAAFATRWVSSLTFLFLCSIVALLNGLTVLLRVFANGSPKDCARSFVSADNFMRDAVSAVHVFGKWRGREGRQAA
jgi:hypothetical protein